MARRTTRRATRRASFTTPRPPKAGAKPKKTPVPKLGGTRDYQPMPYELASHPKLSKLHHTPKPLVTRVSRLHLQTLLDHEGVAIVYDDEKVKCARCRDVYARGPNGVDYESNKFLAHWEACRTWSEKTIETLVPINEAKTQELEIELEIEHKRAQDVQAQKDIENMRVELEQRTRRQEVIEELGESFQKNIRQLQQLYAEWMRLHDRVSGTCLGY
ncbi:uncharacterized protein BXZ73DRAFT_81771 [Epithele typhae]|uniref:uncharacterized protein n=1 Tax=Epithele typhae TaxID=378194 RepID=UPI002008373C|nr:uncharacterized protein BXZ73DRAFT_81771 [Epithele typhae]KAH9913965.1 hypothetical protein BXZ73DRAFT_81771 [Epithele typhae]